jgi:hypothetical protein
MTILSKYDLNALSSVMEITPRLMYRMRYLSWEQEVIQSDIKSKNGMILNGFIEPSRFREVF